MSKRNIRARSGKQLYLNNSFTKGMLYTSSEIPEGYTKIINNFDITPSGDAIAPRSPFAEVKHSTEGLSIYTYPVVFQQIPNKQFYINFPNTITEKEYVENNITRTDYSTIVNNSPINIFSRDNNMLNTTSMFFDQTTNNTYNENNYITISVDYNFNIAPVTINIKEYLNDSSLYSNSSIIVDAIDNYPENRRIALGTTYRVIDADTVVFGETKYRLLNINAPEDGYKWYTYGKSFLNQIIQIAITSGKQIYGVYNTTDVHGRPVIDAIIMLNDKKGISLSHIVLAAGLAKLDYLDKTYPYLNVLYNIEEIAKTNKTRIWDIFNTDILFKGNNIDIKFTNAENNNNYILEVVKTTNSKHINYTTDNCIDNVEFVKINYNDSIAFIGRVLKYTSSAITVYYRGLIYLKYNYKTNIFEIELPPNNLNGDTVVITDAITNGYNLLNTETINTADYTKSSMPIVCDGIVVTAKNDPTTVVQKAIVNQEVTLRAIMNKSWYKYGFNPSYDIVHKDLNISISQINLHCYKSTTQTSFTKTIENIKGDVSNTSSGKQNIFVVDSRELSTEQGDIEITSIDIASVTLLYDYTVKDIQSNKNTKLKSSFTKTYALGDSIISPTNNTLDINFVSTGANSNISLSYDFNTDINTNNVVLQITFTQEPTFEYQINKKELYCQWEVLKSNSSTWEPLTEPDQKLFDIYDSYSEASENLTKWTNKNTLNYTIIDSRNLIFRFKFYPKIEYSFKLDTNNTYTYTTDNTPIVSQTLPIGSIYGYINHEDITEDLNIKDATRIGVYLDQVYLYGPYLKANAIFFSKFQSPWYFAFPYSTIDVPDKVIHAIPWNNNLVMFLPNSIYILTTESTVGSEDSAVHEIYSELSITDTDRLMVKTIGNNLVFFNNNNGYMMVSSKYYNDPTYVTVYKFTDNINNCLANPTYIFRTVRDIPINIPINKISCYYSLHIDNDYINIIVYMISNYEGKQYSTTVIYRYNQLYKYWSTYSENKRITSAYICEPNINTQYITYDSINKQFGILYQDYNNISRDNVECILDTGFLSIDPLNDKRFKDIIIDFNNIANCIYYDKLDRNCINIYNNFFIDGIPITLSDNNPAIEFDYENEQEPNSVPVYDEGDYKFGFVNDIDYRNEQELPFGYNIQNWSNVNTRPYDNADNTTPTVKPNIIKSNYHIKVQGRSQIRIPVFGKGRLPSIAIKFIAKYPYEIVGYSIIYKEKNINRRR